MQGHQQESLQSIRKTSLFNASIEKVWSAVATSEGLAAWFMPNDFEPVPEHEFHLNAGPYGMSPCKVKEIDPPNRLSFYWGKDWTLTFELVERGDKTELTLIHAGWDIDKVTEFGQPHTIVREIMDRGWGELEKLRAYVEA